MGFRGCREMALVALRLWFVVGAAALVPVNAWAEDIATVSVRGQAQLMVPPDQVTLVLGVITDAEQADAALAANSKAMQKVIKALESLGLTKKDYQTQQLNLQPRWSPRPRNATPDWRPQINGYSVSNNLQIKTTKINMVGKLISAATRAGANDIRSVSFGLANPRQYRAQAIRQAMDNARADAEVAAQSAGVAIAKARSINLDQGISIDYVDSPQVQRMLSAEASPVPPVSPGDVTVRASVSVVFELTEK